MFARRNKPKHRKHVFAFAGLLKCAHDGCTVTAELQKGKYVYYRCSHGRGKCSLPYMREQEVSDRMGELLKDICVPQMIAQRIVNALQSDSAHAEAERQKRIAVTQQRIAVLRSRVDQLYEDKLDGKIGDEFWTRKMNEWREQERSLESELSGLEVQITAENVLTVKRVFELANKAHFLVSRQINPRTLLRSATLGKLPRMQFQQSPAKSLYQVLALLVVSPNISRHPDAFVACSAREQ